MTVSVRTIQMYSVFKWNLELRRMFCLGYDPYFVQDGTPEGQAANVAREQLRSLGVFFYRDSERSIGVILKCEHKDLQIDEVTGKVFDPPLQCYLYVGEVLYPRITPIDWTQPTDYATVQKYDKYKQKWNDTKKWIVWGKEVQVTQVATHYIRCRFIKKEQTR